jgi:hypothetical protein
VNCLVATAAANSLITASAYAHTAAKVLAATAAPATAEQQADKKIIRRPQLFGCEK